LRWERTAFREKVGSKPVFPHRLLLISVLPAILVLAGTCGFRLIEGWPWFDALYMTVTTLTTIGFEEIHSMSNAGRTFTMVLAMGGVFTIFFSTAEVMRAYATGELKRLWEKRSMKKQLDALTNHVIICGYGRVGRLVAQEFSHAKVPFVVIDREEDELRDLETVHGVALVGDATSDEILKKAGIDRARAFVAALSSDADNLFITMSARLLNEKLPIVARADEETAARKLERAGATRVVSPYLLGGTRVAQAVLRPTVIDFIEVATRRGHLELQIEELALAASSPLAGRTIDETHLHDGLGIIVVAVKKADGQTLYNPRRDVRLSKGDTLVMLGPREQLDRAEASARAPENAK